MLKRILSAFLLCLCVSPVWADIVKSVRQGVSYCKSNAGIGGWCTDFYLWFDSGNLMISADDYADSLSSRRDDRVDSFVACDVKYCPCEGNNAFNVTEEKGCFYYEEDHRSDQNLWKRASFFEGKVNECTLSSRTNVSLKNGTLTIYVDKTKYTDQQENAKRILMMVGGHEVETPYYHSTNVNDLIGCYTYKCNDGYIVYNGKCTERKSLTPGQICEAGRKTKAGKACCHLRSEVAIWENNQCVCLNPSKEFKMNADGTGECVDKPAEVASGDAGSGGPLSGDADADASQSSDATTDENLQTPVTECADTAKVASSAGETCPGNSNKKINVTATVKDIYTGKDLEAVPVAVSNITQGVWTDNTGKFTLNNIPENAKLEISYGGNIIFYVCASELQNKSLICANSAIDLDGVMVYACAGSVLSDLNALDGKAKQDENGTWCDIVCPNGYTRQEKIQTLQFRDRATGNMIDSPQRYICVANGDVTTDNTATPTPGGGDNSGAQGAGGNSALQNAPAKPDGTPCTPTDKNAKSGKYQNGECIIVECNGAYYKVSDDKKSCVEDKKAKSQAKIDELQKNADALKEKEQSTANKLLGGAAIGATGIGAMQAASAYSEQQADEEAETAMRAYLATFHCNYGGGINVKGGEKDVQLPGGNELIDLYAEYVNLANNLKVRKAALDLRPGIESEAILDSATSGLYDDVAIGKTSGAFTSLARALQDPEGEDAKAWAAQKDDSAKKMKTGLTMAGIGAIGGAVGNLIINKDSEKENSKEILDKYKDGDLTGKVSKSPDGQLVAEPVNQESKPEPGIAIQDKDLGQETNMNQNQNGNWVHIVKPYAVGFYCEDLFDNVYRYCFAMNNEDYARFQQSKFSEITNNAEKCYQRLVQCKQESHTLASVEEVCIRAVASEFKIDMSGATNADCTDNRKTDFTWKSHIFQEQSTVNADATAIVKDGQMILVMPDPDIPGKSVETVVEETQESTPKQDNVVTDYHHGDDVWYIKRIENIKDADAAFNRLAQQFGKTPSNEVKNKYDGFVQKCRESDGVLSIELDTLRSYQRDMYDVLCYFPDLDQTPEIVKEAYNAEPLVFDNSVSISEGIRLSKLAPFKNTQYKKNEDKFWLRLAEFNSTWRNSRRNCKIPELPSLWECTKYSAMIRIHYRGGQIYLEMTEYDAPGGNSNNYFVGKS